MPTRYCGRAIAAAALALSLASGGASAQPAPERPADEARPSDPDAVKAEAKAHYDKGNTYSDQHQYGKAYEEYQKSNALRKSPSTMVTMAICLQFLSRFEEALELINDALRQFPDMEGATKSKAEKTRAELADMMGTLSFSGDMPSGALVFVDDRDRGTLPLKAPLVVARGVHRVRVQKEGFDPITATVEVKAKQPSTALLAGKSKKGFLEVSEKHNWPLSVEVDGADVGVAPWKGLVDAGSHTVRLHGALALEAIQECAVPVGPAAGSADKAEGRAKMGSPSEAATVKAYESTQIKLSAEELDGPLRIESTPSGAILFIDKREIGKTPWEGRLDLGERTIELKASGFADASQVVKVERRREKTLRVSLEAIGRVNAEGARKARVIGASIAYGMGALGLGTFGVAGGLALSKSNELKEACPSGTCNRTSDADIDTASRLGTISVVGLVAGGVGVAVGTVVVLVVKPPPEPAQSAGLVFSPSLELSAGPSGVGLLGRF